MEKLFEESGEYRDRYLLNDQSTKLTKKILVELCDMKSCLDQLYNNELVFREMYPKIIDKTIEKIDRGDYAD